MNAEYFLEFLKELVLVRCLEFGRTYHGLIAKTGLNGDDWGNKPNSYTYSSMLAICGILSTIEEGKQLHAQVVKMQYLSETAVSNALLTMYCKCEAMADAESLFERLP
ncbi:hypothetical protein GOBAR_DD36917 [Gossypium barbadense]|nr:hypothetical protein GOBAR_DD36917 [Gossypium barbadense]